MKTPNPLQRIKPEGLVKLTDWESGEDLYVDLSTVTAIVPIQASVVRSLPSGRIRELGARTRLDCRNGMSFLVRETPAEILA